MKARVAVEVCVESSAGAIAAEQGGADRVELCAGLRDGGVTPSAGAIECARAEVRLNLVVLIRPRPGDFVYDTGELLVMARDIEIAKAAFADGVALGVLDRDGQVDGEATRALVERARPMQVTFHRAFDAVRDPWAALETLAAIGVDRVLTAGGQRTAPEGVAMLAELVQRSAGRVAVMPGGGVRAHNVAELVRRTGVGDVHFSAGVKLDSSSRFRHPHCAGAGADAYAWVATSTEQVRACVQALQGC